MEPKDVKQNYWLTCETKKTESSLFSGFVFVHCISIRYNDCSHLRCIAELTIVPFSHGEDQRLNFVCRIFLTDEANAGHQFIKIY